jgi:hypothetical protein
MRLLDSFGRHEPARAARDWPRRGTASRRTRQRITRRD